MAPSLRPLLNGLSRYSTANGESDCYGEAEQETKDGESEEDEEDEEDRSHVTECTLRRDSSDAETEEEVFSDAESPGDADVPRNNGATSHGARDEGQGPQPHCPNRGPVSGNHVLRKVQGV